jgi:hypothetical protein
MVAIIIHASKDNGLDFQSKDNGFSSPDLTSQNTTKKIVKKKKKKYPETGMKRLSLYIKEEIFNRVKENAIKENRTVNNFIETLLDEKTMGKKIKGTSIPCLPPNL